jgi:hypothetical protein
MNIQVTYDASARDFVLDAFGKSVKNGFVVEKSNPNQRVITPRGEEIPVEKFAGVRKGSAIFVKSDIVSLVETAKAISS